MNYPFSVVSSSRSAALQNALCPRGVWAEIRYPRKHHQRFFLSLSLYTSGIRNQTREIHCLNRHKCTIPEWMRQKGCGWCAARGHGISKRAQVRLIGRQRRGQVKVAYKWRLSTSESSHYHKLVVKWDPIRNAIYSLVMRPYLLCALQVGTRNYHARDLPQN